MPSKYDKLISKKRTEFIDNFWMNLGDTSSIETTNLLRPVEDWQKENPLLYIVDFMRKPENFNFTCRHLFNIRLLPFQHLILQELWNKSFSLFIASRGLGKTFLLAVFSILKALFVQGSRIVLTGAGFRQAKLIFEYCETLWKNSPMFQNILSDDRMNKPTRDIDRCVFRIGTSTITAIPTGNGDKIRGLRSTDLICDEFNSIDTEVFEHVMKGFGSVTATPVDNVIYLSRIDALKAMGEISAEQAIEESKQVKSNKTIIAGTCGYEFESLARYWKKHKAIVESRGDISKLEEIFNGEIPLGFDWKDYSIIRIPYDAIPRGFMDEKQIGQSKATVSAAMFGIEFGAVFAKDSLGFFKRSVIERCTVGNKFSEIKFQSCGPVSFCATMRGDYKKKYVIGVDPASEVDNFTIFVLELWPEHRRIVYGWSINKERFKNKLKKGLVQEHNFYSYCAKKIREVKRFFPTDIIAMDSQGGGVPITEALGDITILKDGEIPIYPTIDEDDPKVTDDMPGEHIIHLVNFADAQWTNDANHGLRKDLEDQVVIFPYLDSAAMGLAIEEDKISGRIKIDPNDDSVEKLYDTLEDACFEIEELKNELALIVHTKTPSGRDHFDTPELKLGIGKKGRLRKDRYSALLMANAFARELMKIVPASEYKIYGGIASQIAYSGKKTKNQTLYTGPDWFMQKIRENPIYGMRVDKGGVY